MDEVFNIRAQAKESNLELWHAPWKAQLPVGFAVPLALVLVGPGCEWTSESQTLAPFGARAKLNIFQQRS